LKPDEIANRVGARCPDVLVVRGEVIALVDPTELADTLAWLRDQPELRFDFLSSLTAVDRLPADPRFWVSYELRSMAQRHRMRIRVGLAGDDPHVRTITDLFPAADWFEREVWDFFGIVFDGHPDLTRIFMPDDWEGFPLRKDEELGGVNTWYHGAFIPPVDKRTGP
jgi:NADH-quinone oxidoreductase subunit C